MNHLEGFSAYNKLRFPKLTAVEAYEVICCKFDASKNFGQKMDG